MQLTPEILERYYQGICSSEEKAAVEQWLNLSEKETEPSADFLQDALWQQIKASAFDATEAEKTDSFFKRYGLYVTAVAALITVVLLPVYFALHSSSANKPPAFAEQQPRWDSIVSGSNFRQSVTLGDGTEITLNFSSILRYPIRFGNAERIVYLSGEAFFKVHKNVSHPFIVKTANGSAQDLGTRFDVDAYPANDYMAVTVTEGKVSFSTGAQNKPLILTAGTRGVYRYALQEPVKTKAGNIWTGWQNGHLSIPDMRMADIAILLKKTYGTDVEISPSLLSRHFTGDFQDVPLEDVARQIAFVLPCNYSIDKNKIHFY